MGFDVKKRFLLDFLILATLLLSCSLLVTSEKMEKLVRPRDAVELPGNDAEERGNSLLVPPTRERRRAERPPPPPHGPSGPGP